MKMGQVVKFYQKLMSKKCRLQSYHNVATAGDKQLQGFTEELELQVRISQRSGMPK